MTTHLLLLRRFILYRQEREKQKQRTRTALFIELKSLLDLREEFFLEHPDLLEPPAENALPAVAPVQQPDADDDAEADQGEEDDADSLDSTVPIDPEEDPRFRRFPRPLDQIQSENDIPLNVIRFTDVMSAEAMQRARTLEEDLIKEYLKKRDKVANKRAEIYANLWSHIDLRFQEAVRRDNDFGSIDAEKDPLKLWRIVKDIATSPLTVINNPLLHMEVLRSYEMCKQGSSTLEYYFRLFQFRLNAALGAHFSCGTEQEQANRFFEGLDNTRFGVFKSNILHGLHPIPRSVQEVYTSALNFEEIRKRGSYTDYSLQTSEDIALPVTGELSRKQKGKKQRSFSPGVVKAHARATSTAPSEGVTSTPVVTTTGGPRLPNTTSAPPSFNLAPCRHCGGAHRHRECPTNNARKTEARAQRESAQAVSRQLAAPAIIDDVDEPHVPSWPDDVQEVTLSVGNTIYPDEWGLDSMAAKSFVRDRKFGFNFRPAERRVRFNGVGGPVICDTICDVGPFKGVYVMENGPGNILSPGDLSAQGFTWEKDRLTDIATLFGPDNFKLEFQRSMGRTIYTTYAPELQVVAAASCPVLQTVDESLAAFSTHQARRIEEARRLMLALALPDPQKVILLLRKGKIRDTEVTVQDILNCIKVYGPSPARLKGTTTYRARPPPTPITETDLERMHVIQQIDLSADLVFVGPMAFLGTVCRDIRYLMLTHLRNKSKSELLRAINSHLAKYTAHGFKVNRIFCDGESGVVALTDELQTLRALQLHTAGSETHLGPIENAFRMLKMIARIIYHSVPFAVPSKLFPYLLQFAATRMNMLPSKTLGPDITPRELLTGKQISAKRELCAMFGDRVIMHGGSSNRVHEPRGTEGLYLLNSGNPFNSHICLSLDTFRVVKCDRITVIRHDSSSIQRVNHLGRGGQDVIPLDAVYHIGNLDKLLPDVEDVELLGEAFPRYIRPDITPIHEGINVTHEPQTADDIIPNEDPSPEPSQPEAIDTPTTTTDTPLSQDTPLDAVDIPDDFLPEAPSDLAASIPPTQADDNVDDEDNLSNIETTEPLDELPDPEDERTPGHNHSLQDRGGALAYNLRPRNAIRRPDILTLPTGVEDDQNNQPYTLIITDADTGENIGAYPITYSEAMQLFESETDQAADNELGHFVQKEVLEPLDPSKLTKEELLKAIPSRAFVKVVLLPDGSIKKVKMRIVAGGHRQNRSLYSPKEISSDTLSLPSLMLILAIIVRERRFVMTIDITAAYLNAKIQREVIMFLPKDISALFIKKYPAFKKGLHANGKVYVRLNKALYGCIESAVLWYQHLTGTLIAAGFASNPKDPCVLNADYHGTQVTVAIYVDDILVSSTNNDALTWVESTLRTAYKEITVSRGDILNFLGRQLDFRTAGQVTITMERLVNELLQKLNVLGSSAYPANTDLFEVDMTSPLLGDSAKTLFHSVVASLLYIANSCRPDFFPAISQLASETLRPTEQSWQKLMKLAKYVNSTKHLGLTIKDNGTLYVAAYIDASFAVHKKVNTTHHSSDNFRGHTGGVITLGGSTVTFRSVKQKLNAKSSTEAELIAISDILPQLLWTKEFLLYQGYSVERATLYQDNMSTIAMIKNGRANSPQTRYIAVRFFWVKDYVDRDEILIEHLPTEDMLADLLTKPLHGETFYRLRKSLLQCDA